jgi:hypothetical protein
MYLANSQSDKAALTYGEDCPYIEIQWAEECIFVSDAVLGLIGRPAFIRFQWHAGKRSLIIEPTDSRNPNGLPVTEERDEQNGLFLYCGILLDEIMSEDLDKDFSFRIVARYNVPSNVAMFDMSASVPVEIPEELSLC